MLLIALEYQILSREVSSCSDIVVGTTKTGVLDFKLS